VVPERVRVRWRQWEHRAGLAAQARAVEAAAMRRLRASPRARAVLVALTVPVAFRVAKFAAVLPRASRGP